MVCRPTCPSIYTHPPRLTYRLGIAVALFFQCIGALINPVNTTRKSVKWGLAAHTTALFLFLTARITIDQYTASTEYIDNRDFSDADELFPPGPIGYDVALFTIGPFGNVYPALFPLNQWLADGLLVSSILKSAGWMSYMVHASSYIVATSFFL